MISFFQKIFKNYSLYQAIRAEFDEDITFLVGHIPGIVGFILRYLVYKPLFGRMASIPYIYPGVRFVYMRHIKLGRSVLINSNSYLYGKGGLEIGDYVLIAPGCSIVAGEHRIDPSLPILAQESRPERIIIGDNSWIGTNAVILGGIEIGKGSIIGAGAVVTKSTEPFSINVGVPAMKIGVRTKQDRPLR